MRRSVSPTERPIVSQPVNPNGAAPAAPALAIRGLVKVYGNLIAVADLSLDIPVGSFYGIVGPNGAHLGRPGARTREAGEPGEEAGVPQNRGHRGRTTGR